MAWRRPVNASVKSAGDGDFCRVWLAMLITTASMFFTRWFNSAMRTFWCSSASTSEVTLTRVTTTPSIRPSFPR